MDAKTIREPAATARAQRAYLESRVLGADPLELLVMLYEGLRRDIIAGQRHLEAGEWEPAHEALVKARRIVTYLGNSLRSEGGEISTRLASLYAFCFDGIGRANLQKDPEPLAAVLDTVSELSGAWSELLKQRRHADAPPGEERHDDA